MISAESPVPLKPLTIITGSPDMVAWNLLILKRSMILRTRTDVLNILFADLNLENRALKDVIEKTLKPAFKHELNHSYDNDIRTQYPSSPPESEPEQNGLPLLPEYYAWWTHCWAERYPRYGFPKLNFRHKGKQRLPVRTPSPLLATLETLNQS